MCSATSRLIVEASARAGAARAAGRARAGAATSARPSPTAPRWGRSPPGRSIEQGARASFDRARAERLDCLAGGEADAAAAASSSQPTIFADVPTDQLRSGARRSSGRCWRCGRFKTEAEAHRAGERQRLRPGRHRGQRRPGACRAGGGAHRRRPRLDQLAAGDLPATPPGAASRPAASAASSGPGASTAYLGVKHLTIAAGAHREGRRPRRRRRRRRHRLLPGARTATRSR